MTDFIKQFQPLIATCWSGIDSMLNGDHCMRRCAELAVRAALA